MVIMLGRLQMLYELLQHLIVVLSLEQCCHHVGVVSLHDLDGMLQFCHVFSKCHSSERCLLLIAEKFARGLHRLLCSNASSIAYWWRPWCVCSLTMLSLPLALVSPHRITIAHAL